MTKSVDSVLLAEIKELRDQLNRLEAKLEETEEQPKVFEVVLKVTTRPNTWGYDNIDSVDNVEVRDHFNSFMYEMKEALRFDDDGDEIEVVNVTEVT